MPDYPAGFKLLVHGVCVCVWQLCVPLFGSRVVLIEFDLGFEGGGALCT
jgi:hypothetical protein